MLRLTARSTFFASRRRAARRSVQHPNPRQGLPSRCPPIAPAHVLERPIASRSVLSASAASGPQLQRPQPFLSCFLVFEGSAPGKNRTCDLGFRNGPRTQGVVSRTEAERLGFQRTFTVRPECLGCPFPSRYHQCTRWRCADRWRRNRRSAAWWSGRHAQRAAEPQPQALGS